MEKVIIIGGGPAGLAAAIYAARAFLEPLVIAGAPAGGQLMLTTEVENYPGYRSILGPDLIQKFREHATHFGTRVIDENVKEVDFSSHKQLLLKLSDGQSLETQAILIATGATAQWLHIPSEQRLRGKGVSACATCDGFFFRGKKVAVVGGGDTAMEEALTLTTFAEHVYLLHRRDEFRASKIMQERVMKNEKITILWGTEVDEVLGQEKVEGLHVKFSTGKSKKHPAVQGGRLDVQGLFLAIGHKPNTDFLKGTDLEIDEKGYLFTASRCAWESQTKKGFHHQCSQYKANAAKLDHAFQYQTNIPGVFAAGDVVDYIYRQAATAVGMGVAAALEIERYLSM